jgi:hypothetical protein
MVLHRHVNKGEAIPYTHVVGKSGHVSYEHGSGKFKVKGKGYYEIVVGTRWKSHTTLGVRVNHHHVISSSRVRVRGDYATIALIYHAKHPTTTLENIPVSGNPLIPAVNGGSTNSFVSIKKIADDDV